MPSAFYNDLVTDTLYAVEGTNIVPWFAAEPFEAKWRSKVAIIDKKPSFGWMRVNGDFTSATVNLYMNGQLLHTTTFTDRKPNRVPVGRGREWEVEVVSEGVVTSVAVATDVKELL